MQDLAFTVFSLFQIAVPGRDVQSPADFTFNHC